MEPRRRAAEFHLQSALPGPLFAAKPPEDANRGRGLCLVILAQRVGQEVALVREVPAQFLSQQESIGQGVIEGQGELFQRLRLAAEQAVTVGKVFCAPANGKLWIKLIARIKYASIHVLRRREFLVTADDVIAFRGKGQAGGGTPLRVAVKDMELALGRMGNRLKRHPLLRRKPIAVARNVLKIVVFLAQIIVDVPVHRLVWLDAYSDHLVFKSIEFFRLLGPVNGGVVRRQPRPECVTGANAHVVRRKIGEPERAGIIHLVFAVGAFHSHTAGPLPKVEREPAANRSYIGSIRLEDIAVNAGAWLVRGISL